MEFKTYVKGKNSIEATETAYEVLYKQQGYKPVADDGKPADTGKNDAPDTGKGDAPDTNKPADDGKGK